MAAPSAAIINRNIASSQLVLILQVALKLDYGWNIDQHYFANNQTLNVGMSSLSSESVTTRFQILLIATAVDEFVQSQDMELDITSAQSRTTESRCFENGHVNFSLGFLNVDGNGFINKVSDSRVMNYTAYPGQNTFTYSFGQSPVLMGNLTTTVTAPKVLYIHNMVVIADVFKIVDGNYIFVDSEIGNIDVSVRG